MFFSLYSCTKMGSLWLTTHNIFLVLCQICCRNSRVCFPLSYHQDYLLYKGSNTASTSSPAHPYRIDLHTVSTLRTPKRYNGKFNTSRTETSCIYLECQRQSSPTALSSSWVTFGRPSTPSGIKLLFSSAYHPQTDGQMAVINCTLSTLLWVLIKKKVKEWEECLPIAEFTYNRTRHSMTMKSPFEVVYGLNLLSLLDILPLPLRERTNMDASARANFMK